MKPSFPLAAGVLALWLTVPAAVPGAEQLPGPPGLTAADPFDALQKALNAEHEAKTRATAGAGREVYETRSYLESMRGALGRGEDATVLNTVNQIEATATTEEVRRACVAIAKKIDKDRIAREQAFAAEVDVAVKRAAEIILRAKSPKEIDGVIADFNRLSEPRAGASSDGDNRMAQKLQGILSFLNGWQDYLDARARGDDQAATNALTSLGAADYNHVQVVPRSEILTRLSGKGDPAGGHGRRTPAETNAAVAELLDRTRTLDDLPEILTKLGELASRGANGAPLDPSIDLATAIADLQALQRMRAELQSGIATTVSVNTLHAEGSQRTGSEGRLTALRAEVIKEALPRLLDAADEKAAEGEGVGGLLRRLIERAKKRGDWVMVSRGIELGRGLATGESNHTSASEQETEAFRQYFAGLNLEAAGQYAAAVTAYLGALKTGARELPATVVGEHLAAIAKAHPKEFAEGNGEPADPPPAPAVPPEITPVTPPS